MQSVEPSFTEDGLKLNPCRATLRSGEVQERVLMIDADEYIAHNWMLWPEDVPGRLTVAVSDVSAIEDSAFRLPAALATAVWRAGEYHGEYRFTVVLTDGRRLPRVVRIPDYPYLPQGVRSAHCASVVTGTPQEFKTRRPTSEAQAAPFAWCLYRTG